MKNYLKLIFYNMAINPAAFFGKNTYYRKLYKTVTNFIFFIFKIIRSSNVIKEIGEPEVVIPSNIGFIKLPSNFVDTRKIMMTCDQLINTNEGISKVGKLHLTHLLTPQKIADYPELLNFALDKKIISIVTEYLGELPVLDSIFLWKAEWTEDKWDNSQLFHFDHDDLKQIKLFMLLGDVTEENGPLTLIPKKHFKSLMKGSRYHWGIPGRNKMKDSFILDRIPNHDIVQASGKKGDLWLVDTCNVCHMGSRIKKEGSTRYMMSIQYLTLNNFKHNPIFKRNYPLAYLGESYDDWQKKILTGNLF